MKNIYIEKYNQLIPLMNKLAKQNYDIWEYHDNYSGYGFNIIFKSEFINVIVFDDYYIVRLSKMTNNILLGKSLKSTQAKNNNEIYEIIKKWGY